MANIMRLGGGAAGGKPKKLLSSLTEGSLISVLEDGKLVPFYVAKHNYEADLNGEGRTLLVRKDLHSERVWNETANSAYATSDIDGWLNNDYKAMLSGTVQSQLGVTEFYYTPSISDKTVTALSRAVFMLSVKEFGLTYSNANAEGSPLPIGSALQIAYLNGTAKTQWTRSLYLSAGGYVCFVSATGGVDAHNTPHVYGIRPCFTLPATMALRDEPFADGAWGLADENILFDTETASTTAKSGITYTNGIADLDADTLHNIASAISANPNITKDHSVVYYDKGDVHRKISVGDTMTVTFNDVPFGFSEDSDFCVIGFNHDDLAQATSYGNPTATGKAGIAFQMVNCLSTTYKMNTSNTNNGGWASSYMRNTNVKYYFDILVSDVKGVIKSVSKLASAGNTSNTINKTDDKLFLLSEIEVFGSVGTTATGEGTQYAYYKAGNSKVKRVSGNAVNWWERSPYISNTTQFSCVSTAGTQGILNASTSAGLAFAYCI